MTITIDCRHIDSSGVGVYLRECLPFFLASPHHFVLLGDPQKLKSIVGGGGNARIIRCDVKPFSLRERFFFPLKIRQIINTSDIYYSPFFNIPGGVGGKMPVFTTIHDIIFPDMPELTSRLGLIARMYCYRRAGKLSHTIFTVSKFSKQRIMHHLGLGEKIVVTGSAIQNYIYNDDDCCGVDVTTGNKTKSILFIGNIKKHKGLAVLLNAFERARKAGLDYTLVIVGSEENFRSVDTASLQYCKDAASDSIRWTGYVSNEELRGLIKSAALLVQPSLYEGFCLPPLEAMMLGTPALISDIPVLKEVYADFPVVFFKAGDAGDLKDKLIALLHNKPFVQVQLDESQRNRYTFKKTAALILEVLGHEAGEGG